jgi:hypothetical protein
MCFTDGLDRRRDWRWLFLAGASGAHHRAPAAGNRVSARLEEGLCTADGESWTVLNPRCRAQEIRAWGIPDPVDCEVLYCTVPGGDPGKRSTLEGRASNGINRLA